MSTYYLMHHGVEGQEWGKRNGPPYPLNAEGKADLRAQKKAQKAADKEYYKQNKSEIKSRAKNYSSKDYTAEDKRRVSKNAVIGAVIAGVAGAAVGYFATDQKIREGKAIAELKAEEQVSELANNEKDNAKKAMSDAYESYLEDGDYELVELSRMEINDLNESKYKTYNKNDPKYKNQKQVNNKNLKTISDSYDMMHDPEYPVRELNESDRKIYNNAADAMNSLQREIESRSGDWYNGKPVSVNFANAVDEYDAIRSILDKTDRKSDNYKKLNAELSNVKKQLSKDVMDELELDTTNNKAEDIVEDLIFWD